MKIEIKSCTREQNIVFIHGTSFGAWCWDKYFVPYFQENGFGTCTFSIRGHGKSEGKEKINRWGVDDYIEDCLYAINSVNKKSIIVAHSVGCLLVMRLLEKYPDIASKVIFIAPANGDGMFLEYIRFFFNRICNKSNYNMYFSTKGKNLEEKEYESFLAPVSAKISFQILKPIVSRKTKFATKALVIGSASDLGVSTHTVLKMGKKLKAKIIFNSGFCHAMMLDKRWRIVADEILDFIK